ncbi:MAG: hypothetical protein ACYS22_12100 [Planctomycetota bacterium]
MGAADKARGPDESAPRRFDRDLLVLLLIPIGFVLGILVLVLSVAIDWQF